MALQPLPHPSGDLAPAGLTVQDQRRIQEALDSSTSANTRRAYNQAWRRFEAWAKDRGRGHPLPASPELVAAFLPELAEEGKSVATLRLTKSALAAVHRSTGYQDPTDNEGVRKVMAGIARVNGRPQRQAKPLTETALAAVKATAGGSPGDTRAEPSELRTPGLHGEGARWTSPCSPCSGTDFSADRRPRRSSGAMWRSRMTARRGSTCAGRRRTRRGGRGPVHRPGCRRGPGGHHAGGIRGGDPSTLVFGLSASQIGRRVNAAAKAAGLGEGFTGHSGRVGMAQDLAAAGWSCPR